MEFLTAENHPFLRKTDYVLDSLRTSILLGHIQPGTTITEKQIRDALKVSSSPVREALNQLEAEGLLTRSPHVGTRVAEVFVEDAGELYAIQGMLQSTALQIAARRLTEQEVNEAAELNRQIKQRLQSRKRDVNAIKLLNYRFHMIVCGASAYPWLTRVISALWLRLPKHTIWQLPKEGEAAVRYHAGIIDAIRKKDAVLAGSLMKAHLQRSHKVLYG
jgi:DNA-binding GntR family transcriptional regulator